MTNKFNGENFFNKLYEDEDFCKQLGKVILSASKLEAQLIKLLESKSNINYNRTMGGLITKVEKAKLLPENTIKVLRELAERRNHLTHNIFIILSDIIEDSKLIESIKEDKYIIKYMNLAKTERMYQQLGEQVLHNGVNN